MSTIQIPYNNSAATLVFGFPPHWNPLDSQIGVNINIKKMSGDDLLASTATTVYTQTELNGAVTIGADNATLDSGASACIPGRQYCIVAGSSGPTEFVVCRYYDATNKKIYFTRELDHNHADEDKFGGRWCTYDLDTSTVATWTKGLQCVIWLTPDTDDNPISLWAEVAVADYGGGDFEKRFEILYPREYENIVYRSFTFADYYIEAKRQLDAPLRHHGVQLDRVVDQEDVTVLLLSYTRYLVTQSGGKDWNDEREAALKEYNRQWGIFTSTPRYIDQDQDQIIDSDEVDDYSGQQILNSEGSI